MPLLPPCTRNVSPGRQPAGGTTFDQTVHATSGSPPAVTRSTPSGIGSSCAAGTATCSRVPAAGQQRAHLVADRQPVTPSPSAAIRPEHSSPMISDAPGGGG